MKCVYVCLHDVRVSGGQKTIYLINQVQNIFDSPISVHLVFDEEINTESQLYKFLKNNIESNSIELVFHGLTHKCISKTGRLYSFYHKYQAEYLVDSPSHEVATQTMYEKVKDITQTNPGICPPCWIASKNNFSFFWKLNPMYIETMSHYITKHGKKYSPVISLGTIKGIEIFMVKILAILTYSLSRCLHFSGVRLVIHALDFERPSNLKFLLKIYNKLIKSGFKPALQREIIQP